MFDFDSAELTRSGKQELHQLTRKLNNQTSINRIEVVGHADSIGSDEYNQQLSQQRAQSVQVYLQQSLQAVAVDVLGMGETRPVADNKTEAGRMLNRRVEVNIKAEQ